MEITARTKLSALPITWKEAYTDKTNRLKDMYEELVGSGSYFRFEGTNTETGDEYYVVVGPAKVKSPKPEFFAGVRKLPSDFAAGGKYFSEMREAMEYANETWGVDTPSGISYYDSDDLKNIGDRVRQWREDNKWEAGKEDAGEEYQEEDDTDDVDKAASSHIVYRFAMGAPSRKGRQDYTWYDIDHAALGQDQQFTEDAQKWPALSKALAAAMKQRTRFRELIDKFYGSENLGEGFYHIWLSFNEAYGAYIVSVGPYMALDKETQEYTPSDRFDAFWKRLNVFSQEFLDKKVGDLLEAYSDKYGVTLTAQDYVPPQAGMGPEFKLTPAGREKVYKAVAKHYGVNPNSLGGEGLKQHLIDKYNEAYPLWKGQLDAAYAKSKANGDAFLKSQPPPPDIRWMKPRPIGQQMNSQAHDEDEGGVKGFDSLKKAIDFVNTKGWAGCPMLEEYKDVTSDELVAARQAQEAKKAAEEAQNGMAPGNEDEGIGTQVDINDNIVVPSAGKKPVKPMPKKMVKKPKGGQKEVPISKQFLQDVERHMGMEEESSTLSRLIVLAENLDGTGKAREAEEIHRILRKHASRMVWASDENPDNPRTRYPGEKAALQQGQDLWREEQGKRNLYKCPACNEEWQTRGIPCADRCPKCRMETDPYRSEET